MGGQRPTGADLEQDIPLGEGTSALYLCSKALDAQGLVRAIPMVIKGTQSPAGEAGPGGRPGQLRAPRGPRPNQRKQEVAAALGILGEEDGQGLAEPGQEIGIQMIILRSCLYLQAIGPIPAPQPLIIQTGASSPACPAPPSLFEN